VGDFAEAVEIAAMAGAVVAAAIYRNATRARGCATFG
jgi:hypothetical protein